MSKEYALCADTTDYADFGQIYELGENECKIRLNNRWKHLNVEELESNFYLIHEFYNFPIKLITKRIPNKLGRFKHKIENLTVPSDIGINKFCDKDGYSNSDSIIKVPRDMLFDNFDLNEYYHKVIYCKLLFMNYVNENYLLQYSDVLLDFVNCLMDITVLPEDTYINSMDKQMLLNKMITSLAPIVDRIYSQFLDSITSHGYRKKYRLAFINKCDDELLIFWENVKYEYNKNKNMLKFMV